jgi:hypothetical protein
VHLNPGGLARKVRGMDFKQILAAVLAVMLAISPAMAAYCSTSCAQLELSAASVDSHDMAGMENCHEEHESAPAENTADTHENCNMAGCHTAASAMIFDASPDQLSFNPDTLRSRFIPKSISTDLPPPVKPPA